MSLPLDELHTFALELADIADGISLDHFGGPVAAVRKPDGSPVTAADEAIETTLRERIFARYPDHALLGEETGGSIDRQRPTWVIDPIDATANFMRGVPVFATLIGVVHAGRSVVGVASAPAMGERWDAARGAGARRNGVPVGVSAVDDLADAHVLHGGLSWLRDSPSMWERFGSITDRVWRTRGFGDFWMHLLVAGGMAEAAFERDVAPWDVAALECLVGEAGGRLTAWDGGSALDSGAVLTTNGRLHEVFSELLADLVAVG